VLLYPFALIVFSMLSEVRALIICCTVLYKYIRAFYIRLPRQFNLHAHCLDSLSTHQPPPLPHFSYFYKTETKDRNVVFVSLMMIEVNVVIFVTKPSFQRFQTHTQCVRSLYTLWAIVKSSDLPL